VRRWEHLGEEDIRAFFRARRTLIPDKTSSRESRDPPSANEDGGSV
jgi:hypothetical protein